MKRKRLVVGVSVLAVVSVGGWFAYKQFFQPAAPVGIMAEGPEGAPVVRVEPVMRQALVQEIFSPGSIEAGNLQEHKASMESPRVSVKVKAGDAVAEGDLLVELDASELLEKVKAQELALLRAETSLVRLRKEIANAPLRLTRELEEAKRSLIEAEANLANALREPNSIDDQIAAARSAVERIRSQAEAAQRAVDQARAGVAQAEANYLANPGDPALSTAYQTARESYDESLKKNQETARETALNLAKAEADLQKLLDSASRLQEGDNIAARLAQVQVDLARVAVREAEEALAEGADPAQLLMSEAEVEAAQATLDKLKANLDSTRVVATAPGVVLNIGVKDGERVQQGAVLVRVGNLERMNVVGQVEAVDLDNLKPGQKIAVTSSLLPLAQFEGTVTEVGQQSGNGGNPDGMFMGRGGYGGESIAFEVKAEVLNPEGKLKTGMRAEMRIETARKEDVLIVPLLAIREDPEGFTVLVVKDYTVEVRQIQVGLVTGRQVEVVSGLEEGEQIVVSPFGLIEQLHHGAQVRVEGGFGGFGGMGGPGNMKGGVPVMGGGM